MPIYPQLAPSGMTVCTPEAHTGTDLKNSASHRNYYMNMFDLINKYMFYILWTTEYKKERLGQMTEMTL